MGIDWMPGRRDAQLAMAQKWVVELPKANGAWTITPAEIAELTDLTEDADKASKSLVGGGPLEIARTREAFYQLVLKMRFLHSRKFFSPPMSDEDFVRLGLTPPDRIRTEHTVVNELVEFEVRLRGIRELEVNFWIKGSDHRAKPVGYDGAVVVWDIMDAPPESPVSLTKHTMASRTPYIIDFEEASRGKTAYIALSWQNERGIRGPWSEIQSAIVP